MSCSHGRVFKAANMDTSRRLFLTGFLGTAASACFGQGVATRKAAVQPRGKSSGLPFQTRYRTARQKLLLRSWTVNAVLERRTLETKSYAEFSRCQFGVLGSTSCLVTSSGEKSFLPDSNSLVF